MRCWVPGTIDALFVVICSALFVTPFRALSMVGLLRWCTYRLAGVLVVIASIGCRPTSEATAPTRSSSHPTPAIETSGASTTGANAGEAADSHQRMIAKLGAIDAFMKQHSSVLSDGKLDDLTALVIEAKTRGDLAQFIELQIALGRYHTDRGRGDEALLFYHQAIDLLPQMRELDPEFMSASDESDLLVLAGLAAIRKAENENCVVCQDGQSCLFPISGKGVHEHREGSELASELLTQALHRDPKNLRAVWLLNIAAMTLGDYPNAVPEAFRLPASRLKSTVEFPTFPNVASKLQLNTFSLAGGAVVDDFDGDDDLDLVVSNWDTAGQLEFFRNRGDGTFERATESANLVGIVGGLNVNHADYDNDGDLDLFVMRGGWLAGLGRVPNSLLENDGTGVFRDVTFDVGLADVFLPTQTSGWADYDNDGDLDLYVGNEASPNQLFLNSNGKFRDVAAQAHVDDSSMTKGVAWGDVNGDGKPDLYVSNLSGDNRLYMNRGDGTFDETALAAGVTKPENGFPVWFWDFDNDGNLDLYASSFEQGIELVAADFLGREPSSGVDAHYRGDGHGGFKNVTRELGLTAVTQPMGCNFGDLDNDGFLDFYLGTGYPESEGIVPNLMYLNVAGERFEDVSEAGGFGHLQKGHGVVFADLDQDGDQDVFAELGGWVTGDAFHNALFENPGFGRNWVKVDLRGTRSNRFGVGARIRVEITEGSEQRSIYRTVGFGSSFGDNPLRQEIGVGAATSIDAIEVWWPTSGTTQRFEQLAVNQTLRLQEGDEEVQVIGKAGQAE